MYKMCKTEQSARRQRQLEEGLKKIMLTKHFEEISVSDLCDQLEVPRKSFYRYFSSKDGALYALIDHTMMEYEQYAAERQKITGRTFMSELESFFQFWVEQKELLDALQKSGMSGVLIERSIGHALTEAVMPKRFLARDSRELQRHVTMFGVCGLMSMVLIWHHDGYNETPAQLARVAGRLLSQPLFPKAETFF